MALITGGMLSQQSPMRLFDRIDSDRDQTVSLDELKAVQSGEPEETVNAAFKTLDRDGDAKITSAEMPLSGFSFSDETLKVLIGIQIRSAETRNPSEPPQTPTADTAASGATAETKTPSRQPPQAPTTWAPSWRQTFRGLPERPAYVKTDEEQRLTADLFARADIDKDGMISQDEWKVEHSLVRKAMVDTGLAPEIMFIPQDEDSDGLISPEEMGVGHAVHIKPSNVIFFGERPIAEQDAMIAERERERDRQQAFNTQFPALARPLLPSLERESAETARQKRQAFEAEYAHEMSGPEGYTRLSDSRLALLRELKPVIDTPALADLLAKRLMQQTLANLETPSASSADPRTA